MTDVVEEVEWVQVLDGTLWPGDRVRLSDFNFEWTVKHTTRNTAYLTSTIGQRRAQVPIDTAFVRHERMSGASYVDIRSEYNTSQGDWGLD